MNDTIVIELLVLAGILIIAVFLVGFILKPFAKKKIAEIISKELLQRNLILQEITRPKFPNTGPFNDVYSVDIVNSIASMMGMYPDFTAYRKLRVLSENKSEEVIWIKIEFDIL